MGNSTTVNCHSGSTCHHYHKLLLMVGAAATVAFIGYFAAVQYYNKRQRLEIKASEIKASEIKAAETRKETHPIVYEV